MKKVFIFILAIMAFNSLVAQELPSFYNTNSITYDSKQVRFDNVIDFVPQAVRAEQSPEDADLIYIIFSSTPVWADEKTDSIESVIYYKKSAHAFYSSLWDRLWVMSLRE